MLATLAILGIVFLAVCGFLVCLLTFIAIEPAPVETGDFTVGDSVEAFGIKGTVSSISAHKKGSLNVLFVNGYEITFNKDGRYFSWAKDPDVKKV